VALTLGLVAALGAALSGCGSGSDEASTDDAPTGAAALVDGETLVVVANSAGTLTTNGSQRVMVALLGDGPNDFLGAADAPATFEFSPDGGPVATETTGEWLSTAGVNLGLYVTHVTFDSGGVWEVRVKGTEARSSFNVGTESAVPDIGDPAPASATPTSATAADLADITTDPDPEPAFYELSVAEAVGSGSPSVIVFATPAFCQTAVCGPTVDITKAVAADHPDVAFVHVEPWDIEKARTGDLVPIEAMTDWSLPTEPWVFVVDAEGRVAASFEGVVGQSELSEALDEL
jgi:hypothetical protein